MIGIRPALPGDAAAIATLLTDLGYPASAPDIPRRLTAVLEAPGQTFVAEDDGDVLGVGSVTRLSLLHRAEPAALLSALVVRPDVRNRGVGRLLVEAAGRYAAGWGCRTLGLTSRDERADAHRFYRGLGFESGSRKFVRQVAHG